MSTPPVLLTRPLADARHFAAYLGVPCVLSPLLKVAFTATPPGDARAVLFTSQNGVRAWTAGGGPVGLPCWCVGPRTAALAREAGFDLRGWAADAAGLVRLVPSDAPPLVHVRGAQARGGVAAGLRARGLSAAEAVLYEACPLPLTAEAAALLRAGHVVAPVFSPRSARLLAEAVPEGALPHLRAVAISPAAAAALPVPAAAVAATPDAAAMRDAILSVLDESGGIACV
ncbi:uroporphyrinogen-III synthase [Jannaschia sp. LMIT008]|uniref:uroporphyrinogen-III synthase n=1 Tax=Jannaschia maritima TaxID=3032585 RepID=UPI002810D785|nr:uroporphyrinogen-III synthase [Jannaschia sp. LMIT008]